MRALCGVPPLAPAARLAGAARFVSLRAPPATAPLVILVDAKARVRDLTHHLVAHLHHNGITDTHVFGIALLIGGDYLFPELESKLSKYAPKSWRSSHTHGLDGNGRPLLELHLRVQFHVEGATLANCGEGARELYVRLLRQEAVARAGSLCCAARTRLAQARSDDDFLREACSLDQLNAHCYRLRAHKREPEPGSVRLYVRASGLTVAPDTRPPATFPWPSIGKLSFDRKKFEIRAGESRITLYSSTDEKSKLLLTLCRDTHRFSMRAAVDPGELRRPRPSRDTEGEQRTSVISSTSSNTTSGVVSDRVLSEDEPEMGADTTIGANVTIVDNGEDMGATPDASETSGVYTMAGSALPRSEDGYGEPIRASVASDCASFYNDGSYMSCDSVDGIAPEEGFRERADSGASGTGSFRGDGSDPTDRQHGPLSAEELSDLIVGRADYPQPPPVPQPDDADSESDYMTLLRPSGPSYIPGHEDTAPSEDSYPETERAYSPPPPVPPKRIDSAQNRIQSLPNLLDVTDGIPIPEIPSRPFLPPPYDPDRRLPPEPMPYFDRELSESLRDLRLGIPVREPPPYPGRACPARFPSSSSSRIGVDSVGVPPPPPLTVYTSQLARSQIEQYRRQLYSDVDYVVYPLQDPAISHRDYLDSKLAAACPRGALCRGGSVQALSDTYVGFPSHAATPRREPPPPPFSRTMSDDNILDSLTGGVSRSRRLPPPPPPYPRRPATPPEPRLPERPRTEPAPPLDIKTLREKSKNLDLPLIAALCNDKSLLKQTKAFVMPRHGTTGRVGRGGASLGGGSGGGKGKRGCHRHPGDALPDLPGPPPARSVAVANTYVPDPHPRPPAVA